MYKRNEINAVKVAYGNVKKALDKLSLTNRIKDQLYQTLLSQQDPDIKFTIEPENNHNLPFLDVLITKLETRFDLSIYRKPTHSDRYLRYDSCNHPIVKNYVVYSLVVFEVDRV